MGRSGLLLLIIAVVAGAAVLGGVAMRQLGPASSYDDCVVKHMGGAAGETAAKAVLFSCRKLFPEPERPTTPEPAIEDIVERDPDLRRWREDEGAWRVVQEVDEDVAQQPLYRGMPFSIRQRAVVAEAKRRLGEPEHPALLIPPRALETWMHIIARPEVAATSLARRAQMRDEAFERLVAPGMAPTLVEPARAQWRKVAVLAPPAD